MTNEEDTKPGTRDPATTRELRAHVTTLDRMPVGSFFRFAAIPGSGSYKNLSVSQLDALRSVCVVVRKEPGLCLVRPVRDIKGLANHLTGGREAGAEVWYIGSTGVVGLVVP